uniref:FHA domain-containing protein n=2 Tax=Spongospora subterranea TaxID=70186 RepID=A0A0H5RBJ2_9EUKA|eukprot:CRZ11393.1 hypothetical protein [Spongospora subterranea]
MDNPLLGANAPTEDLQPAIQPNQPNIVDEWFALLRIGVPLATQNMLVMISSTIAVIMVGNTSSASNVNLDASSLASMYSNISGLSVGTGLTFSLDTLFANANGSMLDGDRALAALYTQRSLLVLAVAFIPIALANAFTFHFLYFVLGQQYDISVAAAGFAHRLLPGLPFMFISCIMTKSLQARSIIAPTVVIGIISNTVNLALCFIFLEVLHLFYYYGAWARSISSIIAPVLYLCYFWYHNLLDLLWRPWQGSLVCNPPALYRFVCLSVHSCLMIVGEWWAFEFTYAMAGWLSPSDVNIAAHTILFTLNVIKYVGYSGFASAASIRVGNHLGRGDSIPAKAVAVISITSVAALSLIFVAVTLCFLKTLTRFYTDKQEIIDLVLSCSVPVSISEVAYATLMTAGGVLRGCGRQKVGSVWIAIGYAIGLPMAFLLSKSQGLGGIWWGNALALIIAALASVFYLVRVSWVGAAREAQLGLMTDTDSSYSGPNTDKR